MVTSVRSAARRAVLAPVFMAFASLFVLCAGSSAQELAGTGEFLADVRTGCKIWYPKQESRLIVSWNGACENGLAYGPGLAMVLRSGEPFSTLKGTFREGKLNGRGSMDAYTGDWRDGLREGRGTQNWCTFKGCRKYVGAWKDDRPNGEGTYTEPEQKEPWTGTWRNGCFDDGKRRMALEKTSADCGFN